MTVSAFPLQWPEGWPRTPYHRRQRSPFKVNAEIARRHLHNQLRLLGARNVVLSTNVPLRADGLPYADAMTRRYDDPGVAVYFTLRNKQHAMARDLFLSPQHNIRSLGLAIEAMRAIERHGGGLMMERAFAGFEALPAPAQWWDILQVTRDASLQTIEANFRRLAFDHHPDRGGSDAKMAELNQARADALKEKGAA